MSDRTALTDIVPPVRQEPQHNQSISSRRSRYFLATSVTKKLDHNNLHQGILTVRDSKNHNSRLVPMPESMTLRLRRYAGEVHPFPEPSGYFFPGYGGKPMTLGNIYKNFRRFLWKAGIPHTGDGPRVHDFRHAYCIYRLKQWAQQNRDLMVLIPMMRTYLGHQTFHETAYYLRWTADVFPDIRVKLEKCYQDIIPEMEGTARETD